MAIKTAAEITKSLSDTAERVLQLRKSERAIKEAFDSNEPDIAPRNVDGIRSPILPLTKTER